MPARTRAATRPRRSAERTITKFLLAAEEIYGEHGYEGTTIRAIAKKARANLGTLQHYWGSKRQLFRDLFETRFRPLQQEHLRQLREIEERHSDGSRPPVMEVLQTLIETTFFFSSDATSERASGVEQSEARRRFQTLYGRALMDPSPEVLADTEVGLDDTRHRDSYRVSARTPKRPTEGTGTVLVWGLSTRKCPAVGLEPWRTLVLKSAA